ncbi:hypothetical protein [Nostoc sp. DedQUE08]|uniref:hypothetical protein n=1 Tax=Nostoc sp. DedQUE08 TaxID=3075393 RepID=UPI002AD5717A|nr:hypothetical protein [Nostoc sp. DedQUE08]
MITCNKIYRCSDCLKNQTIDLFVRIYESDAYNGLRLRTYVLDRGATKFEVPQNDFGVPQHDFGVPQNDFGVPQNDFEVPQNDFEVPQNDFEVPQHDFGVPQHDF